MPPSYQLIRLITLAPLYLVWGAGLLACSRHRMNRPQACKWVAAAIWISIFSYVAAPLAFGGLVVPPQLAIFILILIPVVLVAVPWILLLRVIFRLKDERNSP